jgi:hypothetical protein
MASKRSEGKSQPKKAYKKTTSELVDEFKMIKASAEESRLGGDGFKKLYSVERAIGRKMVKLLEARLDDAFLLLLTERGHSNSSFETRSKLMEFLKCVKRDDEKAESIEDENDDELPVGPIKLRVKKHSEKPVKVEVKPKKESKSRKPEVSDDEDSPRARVDE